MKKCSYFAVVMALLIGLSGCTFTKGDSTADDAATTPRPESPEITQAPEASSEPIQTTKSFITLELDSKAIANNQIEDTSKRNIHVYLPPSYYDSEDKYPVVYFLDGYGNSSWSFLQKQVSLLDKEFEAGAQQFIMVSLDGNNKTGGSFYVNSPVSGNWEDFVVQEVVALIDSTYRTRPESQFRGISGYSMGGFGALNLSMKHPEVFGSTLVFGPGIFKEENIDDVFATWKYEPAVKHSYAQAFSPNMDNEEVHGNIPEFTGTSEDNQIIEDWLNGFSGWNKKVDDYLALNQPLKGLMIAYSDTDFYPWIPKGCEYLSEILDKKEIPHTVSTYSGGHIVPNNAVKDYFIPFFNKIFHE